ncbi:MAG: helix-turn-helix domain-containing protein [Rikenellaceae bacterium]
MEQICNKVGDRSLNKWLDNQDVCEILNIKPRTLQSYRDSGRIAYSQIGKKIFYRPEDVLKLLNAA